MRAVVAAEYGGPEVLRVEEHPDPLVWPDGVLVRVKAASINPVDYKIVAGALAGGFPSYLPLVPGWDVAGTVEAVGPAVTTVREGQRVFGYARKDYIGDGTWAELVTLPERVVSRMPTSVGFAEASAIPLAGLTAYQAVAEKIGLRSGETVLVHGASGGVGTFAVQIAAALGGRALGTASAGSAEHLRGLGAEHVEYGDGLADRVRALAPEGVDGVVDLVGGDALTVSPELVRDPHRIVSVTDVATVRHIGGQYLFVRPDVGRLQILAGMVDAGALRVLVAERYGMTEARAAVERAQRGHIRGKIVLEADFG